MLTLIVLSAALMQQPPAPPAPPTPPEIRTRFMVMGADGPGGLDKDGDGQITREEFSAPMADHFARMDKDGDGRLSTAELTEGHGSMGEDGEHNMLIMRGPGGPGAAGVRRFHMRRSGGDGAHAGHGEARTMVFVDGDPGAGGERRIVIHGGPGDASAAWASAPAEGGPAERIEIRRVGVPGGANGLDTDNDGRLSEAEFSAPLREAFARMDADGSGFIEDGERTAGSEVFVHRIETRRNSED